MKDLIKNIKTIEVPEEAIIVLKHITGSDLSKISKLFEKAFPNKKLLITSQDVEVYDLTKAKKVMIK